MTKKGRFSSNIRRTMNRLMISAVLLFSLTLPRLSEGTETNDLVREARRAGVPASSLEDIVKRAHMRGYSEDSVSALVGILVSARKRGLYLDPIVDKILEGLAKGAPPEAVERVSRQVMSGVALAEDDIAGLPLPDSKKHLVIEVILDVRSRGMNDGDIRDLLAAFSSEGRGTAPDPDRMIAALDGAAGLIGIRVEPDRAVILLKEAALKGFSRADIRGLNQGLLKALDSLTIGEKDSVVSSTIEMIREGRSAVTIGERLRMGAPIPERSLGVGKGQGPTERQKEGISPGESEQEHEIPRPAPHDREHPGGGDLRSR